MTKQAGQHRSGSLGLEPSPIQIPTLHAPPKRHHVPRVTVTHMGTHPEPPAHSWKHTQPLARRDTPSHVDTQEAHWVSDTHKKEAANTPETSTTTATHQQRHRAHTHGHGGARLRAPDAHGTTRAQTCSAGARAHTPTPTGFLEPGTRRHHSTGPQGSLRCPRAHTHTSGGDRHTHIYIFGNTQMEGALVEAHTHRATVSPGTHPPPRGHTG